MDLRNGHYAKKREAAEHVDSVESLLRVLKKPRGTRERQGTRSTFPPTSEQGNEPGLGSGSALSGLTHGAARTAPLGPLGMPFSSSQPVFIFGSNAPGSFSSSQPLFTFGSNASGSNPLGSVPSVSEPFGSNRSGVNPSMQTLGPPSGPSVGPPETASAQQPSTTQAASKSALSPSPAPAAGIPAPVLGTSDIPGASTSGPATASILATSTLGTTNAFANAPAPTTAPWFGASTFGTTNAFTSAPAPTTAPWLGASTLGTTNAFASAPAPTTAPWFGASTLGTPNAFTSAAAPTSVPLFKASTLGSPATFASAPAMTSPPLFEGLQPGAEGRAKTGPPRLKANLSNNDVAGPEDQAAVEGAVPFSSGCDMTAETTEPHYVDSD
eukprot:jgi/Botrbrau1/525/Bobra.110_2s0153.1